VAESHCAVITTIGNAEAAEELGRGIVEARLGACVQVIGPIRSLYWWERVVFRVTRSGSEAFRKLISGSVGIS
jgi:uncharacterized protein involved in tolerance to divalent cations